MTKATKAAAMRWLADHAGGQIHTTQESARGNVWDPGIRTLDRRGNRYFLDSSELVINTPQHRIVSVAKFGVVVDWHDEDDQLIHTTAYVSVQPEDMEPQIARVQWIKTVDSKINNKATGR